MSDLLSRPQPRGATAAVAPTGEDRSDEQGDAERFGELMAGMLALAAPAPAPSGEPTLGGSVAVSSGAGLPVAATTVVGSAVLGTVIDQVTGLSPEVAAPVGGLGHGAAGQGAHGEPVAGEEVAGNGTGSIEAAVVTATAAAEGAVDVEAAAEGRSSAPPASAPAPDDGSAGEPAAASPSPDAVAADDQLPAIDRTGDDAAPAPAPGHVASALPTTRPTAAPAEAVATPVPPATVDQLVEVVAPLRQLGDGSHTMTLELRPEELGRVEVAVTVEDGVIHVGLSADLVTTRELLRHSLADLRAALESSGVGIGDLGVGVGGAGDGADRSGTGGDADPRRSPRFAGTGGTGTAAPVAASRPTGTGVATGLDLFL